MSHDYYVTILKDDVIVALNVETVTSSHDLSKTLRQHFAILKLQVLGSVRYATANFVAQLYCSNIFLQQ